jgi:hypothetical protein
MVKGINQDSNQEPPALETSVMPSSRSLLILSEQNKVEICQELKLWGPQPGKHTQRDAHYKGTDCGPRYK